MLYYIMYYLALLPFKLICRVKVKGKQNLIKSKAVLCCNHHSNLDFVPIYYAAKTRVYSLAKKELFSSKFKAWFMGVVRAIPIDRKKPEISSIKNCLNVLNKNYNLLVFPEGTRTDKEDVEGVKNGAAMFALKSKSPIIPMVYLKKQKPFRKNTLVVGEPIYFNLDYNKENLQVVVNTLEEKMNELLKLNEGEK